MCADHGRRGRATARPLRGRALTGAVAAGCLLVVTGCSGGDAPERTSELPWDRDDGGRAVAADPGGLPVIDQQSHDGLLFTVTVSPGQPGWNLVRVGVSPQTEHADGHAHHHDPAAVQTDAPARVGTDLDRLRPTRTLPGADGRWARVWLEPGDNQVFVSHGAEHRIPFGIDTGDERAAPASATGADGAECAMASAGMLLAGGASEVTTCPSDALTETDAATLADSVTFLAGRGLDYVRLVSDGSARSQQAAAVVEESADEAGIAVVAGPQRVRGYGAVVAVSGWAQASRTLARHTALAQRRPVDVAGAYLAPWLLTPEVLSHTPAALLPLGFDVRAEDAQAFATALRQALPDASPTEAAYAAWSAGTDAEGDQQPVRIFAASRVSVPMGHDHAAPTVGWYPGGTVTPVTPPLTDVITGSSSPDA